MPELDDLYNAIFSRPHRGPGARAACGTPSGYERHRNDGEEACDACRKANTEYKAAQNRRPVVAPNKLKPIAHGTLKGYKQHRYRQEDACAACKAAVAAYQRDRSALAKGAPTGEDGRPKHYLTEEEWQARQAGRRNGGVR
jgi:hypothetical protein